MVKYPGGTPGRWEKVACDMGRSVKDVSTLVPGKVTHAFYYVLYVVFGGQEM